MKLICRNIKGLQSNDLKSDGWLTIGREYVVLGIYGRGKDISFRILGDDGRIPALHSAEQFEIQVPELPANWVFHLFPGSDWEIGPTAWSGEGFWNAYFDGDALARDVFEKEVVTLDARLTEASGAK